MANRYWDGGTSTDPTNVNNWSDTDGGATPASSVPGTGDVASFTANGDGNACTMTAPWTLGGLVFLVGYTSKFDAVTFNITMDDGADVTLDGGGEFDCGTGSHSFTNCIFDIKDQATWEDGTSTGTFNGTCIIIGHTQFTFKNFAVANSASVTLSIANLNLGSGSITIGDNATLDGSKILISYANLFTRGIESIINCSVLLWNAASSVPPGIYGGYVEYRHNLDVNRTITHEAGTYTVNGSKLEFSTRNTGTLTIDNSTNGATFIIAGDLIVDENVGGAITIDDSGQSVDWDIRGDVIDERTGDTFTWTKGTGTVDLSGTADQAVDFMDEDPGQLTIAKGTSGTVDIEAAACELGAVTMADDLTVTNSTLTSSADAKTIDGNVDLYDAGNDINAGAAVWFITRNLDISTVGTWTPGTAVFTATGSAAADWNLDGQIFGAIVINRSGSTPITFSGDVTAASFTGTAGTWNPSGRAFVITGDFITSVGFVTTNAAGVMNSCTIIVGGNLNLAGQSGTLLRLLATSGWTLTVTGTATARGVEVEYSDASGGTEITANSCIDGENNSNWNFISTISNMRIGGDIIGREPSIQLLPDKNVKILI